jgi:hypothetical protein
MRWLLTPILAFSLVIGDAAAAPLPEPEIWFNGDGSAADYTQMWTDTAPWTQAASKVKVVQLVDWWVRNPANYPVLVQIIGYAKRHHMEIALDTEPVAKFPTESCGVGEGYSYQGDVARAVKILSDLGVRLDWVDMDEPVWFGSYSTDPQKCHVSITEMIRRTALIMHEVTAVYPNVKIMEIEPIPGLMQTSATWRADETAFHIGLARELGIPVRTMLVDVQWSDPAWRQTMLDLHHYLRESNLGFGIIYNGSDQSLTDADWINSAVGNIETIEGGMNLVPEQVVFTTWNPHPANNMPETSPTTQTWLINRYVRPRSSLQVQFVGSGAHGKLTTLDGKPIANATVQGFKPGVDFSKPLPAAVVTGAVPPTAVSALIGVRINTECGNCDGLNDLLLGSLQYQESLGGSARMSYSFPATPRTINGAIIGGEVVGGTTVARIIADSGRTLVINSNVFPVTANSRYQFTMPAATIGGRGWFGVIILIWIDKNGNGTRMNFTPPAGKALTSSAVTNPDGTFNLPKIPRNADSTVPVSVEFDGGNGNFRSTVWTPVH